MATKSPSSSSPTAPKKQSVKLGQTPLSPPPADLKKKSFKSGEVAPPLDPNAKKSSLKLEEGTLLVDPNAPPPIPKPSPPPVFRPWTRKIRPPWEKPARPPPRQRPWIVFHPAILKRFKLPAQVEFADASWTRTMLDITMKKQYPQAVKVYTGPVAVTHELHDGPVQVFLQPVAKNMPNYPECQISQFSSSKPF